jgi:hypothetical protein
MDEPQPLNGLHHLGFVTLHHDGLDAGAGGGSVPFGDHSRDELSNREPSDALPSTPILVAHCGGAGLGQSAVFGYA